MRFARLFATGALSLSALLALPAAADSTSATEEDWSVHGQLTNVTQYHPRFASPYAGPNSLDPANEGRETTDLTLFLGARLWRGGEAYADGEAIPKPHRVLYRQRGDLQAAFPDPFASGPGSFRAWVAAHAE